MTYYGKILAEVEGGGWEQHRQDNQRFNCLQSLFILQMAHFSHVGDSERREKILEETEFCTEKLRMENRHLLGA